jgi:hypothetical protein
MVELGNQPSFTLFCIHEMEWIANRYDSAFSSHFHKCKPELAKSTEVSSVYNTIG